MGETVSCAGSPPFVWGSQVTSDSVVFLGMGEEGYRDTVPSNMQIVSDNLSSYPSELEK